VGLFFYFSFFDARTCTRVSCMYAGMQRDACRSLLQVSRSLLQGKQVPSQGKWVLYRVRRSLLQCKEGFFVCFVECVLFQAERVYVRVRVLYVVCMQAWKEGFCFLSSFHTCEIKTPLTRARALSHLHARTHAHNLSHTYTCTHTHTHTQGTHTHTHTGERGLIVKNLNLFNQSSL
jgi:hypothetical protein